MAYLIGIVIIAASMVVALLIEGGPVELFKLLDGPSLVFVVIPAAVFSITASSWKQFIRSWKLVFSNKLETTSQEVQSACAVLNTFGVVSLLVGIMGHIIGIVLMLQDLSNPDLIGPNFAVASVPIFYGIVFRFLCFLAGNRAQNRLLVEN